MNDHVAGKVDGRDFHVMIPDRRLPWKVRLGAVGCARELTNLSITNQRPRESLSFFSVCFRVQLTREKECVHLENSTGLLHRSRILSPCDETAFGGIVGVL